MSTQAIGTIQLVVSELMTNARTYAPGPCLLTLQISVGAVDRPARPGDRHGGIKVAVALADAPGWGTPTLA